MTAEAAVARGAALSRRALALLPGVLLASPARAESVVYPPGGSVGLVPPQGFALASSQRGFARGDGASILITELPGGIEAQVAIGFTPHGLLRAGIIEIARREVALPASRRGVLLTAQQRLPDATGGTRTVSKWILLASGEGLVGVVTATVPLERPEPRDAAAIERALTTVRFRALDPMERRAALPFAFADAEGLRFAAAIGGSAVILTPSGTLADGAAGAVLAIALSIDSVRAPADRRGVAARSAMRTLAGLRDLRITVEEPVRLPVGAGVLLMGVATDRDTGGEVRVAQWLVWLPDQRTVRGVLQGHPDEIARLLPAATQVMHSLSLR